LPEATRNPPAGYADWGGRAGGRAGAGGAQNVVLDI